MRVKILHHHRILLISKILDKYPDFDPNWSPDVQKSWMEGMIKLYDGSIERSILNLKIRLKIRIIVFSFVY